MSTILDEILLRKKNDLVKLKASQSLSELKKTCGESERSFYKAFDHTKTHYILECKKASPSKGLIRKEFDPQKIAKIYNSYATAISVLTDTPYFQGSFNYLKEVRVVSDLPLLCKDFIVDEYQIYLARFYGADAILLILEILNDEEYVKLRGIAESLKMGVLTEVVTEEQAHRAKKLKSKIVGINNRNLKDFSIDPYRAVKLATILRGTVIISESGIENHADIFQQQSFVHGFLIGTALMKNENIDWACRSLLFGDNKLCGIKSQNILDYADRSGFTYVGYNFVPSSKRYISIEIAVELKSPLKKVGVFQNENIDVIISYAKRCFLSAIQLHGKEDNAYVEKLRESLDLNIKIWKAISVDECQNVFSSAIDLFIIDSKNNNQFGGTGKSFDWSKIVKIPKNKILLAGGIGIENIDEALKQGFLGVDLNSKLEDHDGQKSSEKIKEIFNQIKKFRG